MFDFETEWKSRDNQNIMRTAAKRYRKTLSYHDILECKLQALWTTLADVNKDKSSFNTFLYLNVSWLCGKRRRTELRYRKHFFLCASVEVPIFDDYVDLLDDPFLMDYAYGGYTYKELRKKYSIPKIKLPIKIRKIKEKLCS